MARTWLSITVELLGGRGTDLWPWPGRTLAVGPSHTFLDLAAAVNDAFARWDLSHLSVFTLSDGTIVTDAESAEEWASPFDGPVVATLDMARVKVVDRIGPGDEFRFVFDVGDDWVHRCTVGTERLDPVDVVGVRPKRPTAYWGWGSMPDQYGRRSADDDGESRLPARPAERHPMLTNEWPDGAAVALVDLAEIRASVATRDADRFLAAVRGAAIDDALQQVGEGLAMALSVRRDEAEPVALTVLDRLRSRGAAGDETLADDILALLRGEPLAGRVLAVDLDQLASELEGDASMSMGGYLDLHTGEVFGEDATDSAVVGEDAAVDVDADPDRWLWFDRLGSRDGWRDMAEFAARQSEPELRGRLERALEGRGAFRRFKDVLHEAGLGAPWHAFSADRQAGRARAFLANNGIHVDHS